MSDIKMDQKNIRKYHYFMLLSLIQKHKQVSRTQLSELTQMSNTSVGKIIKSLIEDELVIEVGQTEGELGRRATLLEINPQGAYIIGVQIDNDEIQIACISLNGTILEKRVVECQPTKKVDHVLDKIASEIIILTDELGEEIQDKIIAVGVSLPGLVSWPEGEVLMAPQLNWRGIQVKTFLEEKLNFDVYVDNHVRTVLLAESYFGNLNKNEDVICIHVGSGVGSAVMVNGEILRGANNTLGEIGHITMDPNGSLCSCGRLGCLQTFICSSEIKKQSQKSINEVFNAYQEGEDWAVRLCNRAKNYLGIAISNAICLYSPKIVLLTGSMIEKYPFFTHEIEKVVNNYVWTPLKESFKIVNGTIGEDSVIIGASALVLNEFLRYWPKK